MTTNRNFWPRLCAVFLLLAVVAAHAEVLVGSQHADASPWVTFNTILRVVTSTNIGGTDANGRPAAVGDLQLLVEGDGTKPHHWWRIGTTNPATAGSGSGFPLTGNVSLATFTMSNGSFVGNGSGLTNLPPAFPLQGNVSLAGHTMSNGTFSGNGALLTNLTFPASIPTGTLILTNAFGTVTVTVGPDGAWFGDATAITQSNFALAVNNYAQPTNVVISSTSYVFDVGHALGRPIGTFTLATNTIIKLTNYTAGMTGFFTITHTNVARTLTFQNAVVISGTVSTNSAKRNLITWAADSSTNVLLNISNDY